MNIFRQILCVTHNLKHWLWRLLSTVLDAAIHTLYSGFLLLLISLLVIYQGYSFLGQYPKQLNHWLSLALQQSIEVQQINTRWENMSPILSLQQVAVAQTTHNLPWLQLQRAEVHVDLWASLLARKIITHHFFINGLQLRLRQHPNGRVSLPAKINSNSRTAILSHNSPRKLLDWLRAQQQISVKHSQMTWLRTQQSSLLFKRMDLRIEQNGDNHSIQVELALPEQRAPLPFMQSVDLQAQGGLFKLFAQGKWHQQGHLLGLSGYARLENVQFSNAQRQLSLKKFSTNIELKHQLGVGWRLNLHHLRFDKDNAPWPRSQITLLALPTSGGMHLQGHIGFIQLKDVLTLLSPHIEPQTLRHKIQSLDPEAELHNSSFAIDPHYWQFNSHILNWRNRAHDTIPALTFSDAYLHLAPHTGQLQLQSQRLTFHAPRWYAQDAFPAFNIQGKIKWHHDPTGWRVDNQLHISSKKIDHINLQGSLQKSSQQAINSDLHIKLTGGKIDQIARYFPKLKKIKAVKNWLQHSLIAGKISHAQIDLVGKLKSKIWLSQLKVKANVEQVTLAYAPKWPSVKNLNAEIIIEQQSLSVKAHSATISGSHIDKAQAHISNLMRRNNSVQINAKVSGKLQQGQQFLAQSPLHQQINLNDLQLQGALNLNLSLDIPFKRGQTVKTQGHIQLDKVQLQHSALQQLQLGASHIQGQIYFSHQSLNSEQLQGQIAGQTVHAQLNKQRGQALKLNLTGQLNRQNLQQFVKQISKQQLLQTKHWQALSGSSLWQLQISLAPNETELVWQSDLKGISLDLPYPLQKQAEQKQPIQLKWQGKDWHWRWQSPQAQINLRINYANQFMGLGLNQAAPMSKQKRPHWYIQGHLATFSPQHWQTWWQTKHNIADNTQSVFNLPTIYADISLDTSNYLGQTWHKLQLTGQQDGDKAYWQWQAQESKGNLDLNKEQIRLDLAYLYLQKKPHIAKEKNTPLLFDKLFTLPALWLQCADLHWGKHKLGNWLIVTEPDPKGIKLRGLKIQLNTESKLEATGLWQKNPSTTPHKIKLQFESSDLANLFQQWQIKAQGLRTEHSLINFEGKWYNSLFPQVWQDLEAKVDILLNKGVLEELEPGALARVLALIDIESLPKRLIFKFEDVAKQGFYFEQIAGELHLENGLLYSDNLYLKAVAADILINGYTNLNTQTFSQNIKILPNITYGLPVTGVLLGGYGVGIVALLLQQLWFHNSDEALMYLTYRLEGDWNNPSLRRDNRELDNTWEQE